MNKELEILYSDKQIIAVNKPPGLLVHRTKLANDADEFALQIIRNQIGQKVYPIHRLDRKTSGVLLFALDSNSAGVFQTLIKEKQIEKKYFAIVRGYFPEKIEVDYPLCNEKGKEQDAVTNFKCLQTTELNIPFGKHQTSRYSLIEAIPITGRMHQIRKHLNHLRHPIIGDRPHGCNKQNKLFKEKWNLTEMMLHAKEISLKHTYENEQIRIEAPFQSEFLRISEILGFKL